MKPKTGRLLEEVQDREEVYSQFGEEEGGEGVEEAVAEGAEEEVESEYWGRSNGGTESQETAVRARRELRTAIKEGHEELKEECE